MYQNEYDGCRIYLSEDINTESKDSATMLSIYKSKSYKKAWKTCRAWNREIERFTWSKRAAIEVEKILSFENPQKFALC